MTKHLCGTILVPNFLSPSSTKYPIQILRSNIFEAFLLVGQ